MPSPTNDTIAQELAAIPALEDRIVRIASSIDGRKSLSTALGREAQSSARRA